GGMGLNSGIHDAWALAGALADAGPGGERAAVQRYAIGRRAIAERVVQPATAGNRATADVRSVRARRGRPDGLPAAFSAPARHAAFATRAAMLDAIDGPAGLAATAQGRDR